ncbi:MAG: hypothetical protein C0420_07235, partial [Methylobacterium sp.]|nr:hypothetical protein [Methylobacterium sp.]
MLAVIGQPATEMPLEIFRQDIDRCAQGLGQRFGGELIQSIDRRRAILVHRRIALDVLQPVIEREEQIRLELDFDIPVLAFPVLVDQRVDTG